MPQISIASSSLNWTTTMRSCTSSLRVPLQSVDEPVPNEKEFMSVLKEMGTEISIWSSSPCLAYMYSLSGTTYCLYLLGQILCLRAHKREKRSRKTASKQHVSVGNFPLAWTGCFFSCKP